MSALAAKEESWLRKQLPVAAVCVAMFSNSVALMNAVPYAPFMVMDYGLTKDKAKTGFYAGYIMSAFMLGRFLSSFYCGRLADKVSRKFVLRLGLWSCALFGIAFGMAPTYSLALLSRLLMGLFNGIAGAAKAILPELVPIAEQQRAMGLISGMWNAGQVFGPSLGGLLAKTWPQSFPYLLPNLLGSVLSLISLIFVERYLPGRPRQTPARRTYSLDTKVKKLNKYAPVRATHENEDETIEAVAHSTDDFAEEEDDDDVNTTTTIINSAEENTKKPRVPLSAAAPIAIYSIFSLVSIAYDEMFPLFLLLPVQNGGCSMLARDIGVVMSATAIGNLILQFTVFPYIAMRIGSSALFRASSTISAGLVLLPPLLAAITTSRHAKRPSSSTWLVLIAHNILYRFATSAAYTSTFCCINNSAPASLRGTVNGLSMTIASLFKAAGPTIGGAAFAWSLKSSQAPFHSHFVFICTALSYGACSLGAFAVLDKQFDKAYEESFPKQNIAARELLSPSDKKNRFTFTKEEDCPRVVIEMTTSSSSAHPSLENCDEEQLPACCATVSLSSNSSPRTLQEEDEDDDEEQQPLQKRL